MATLPDPEEISMTKNRQSLWRLYDAATFWLPKATGLLYLLAGLARAARYLWSILFG